ncbi:hypothetical protein AURDEDRAFT_173011 [Auricularia subglabra TFB-10046 SS5]|uniref:Protein kinase domain-containing protein n=1 Tax=Auricularia subglabra (strain TFB-10046 / SS5) TaxID=717982 RepID=J0WWF2_AURST|nr:hypothetical protein AURDEDRAFT_173011 [Auricularia subglabra TFB-10046 SS5]
MSSVLIDIPGLVDVALRFSRAIVNKIREYAAAHELFQLDLDQTIGFMDQLSLSLDFVLAIAPSLSPHIRRVISDAVSRLNTPLATTQSLLSEAVDSDGKLRRIWFTVVGKSSLQKSLAAVDKQHDLFLRCLHYSVLFGTAALQSRATASAAGGTRALARISSFREAVAGSQVDARFLLPPETLPDSAALIRLHSHSDIRIVALSGGRPALVEYRDYQPDDPASLRRLRDVASILSAASPDMSILPCLGFKPLPATKRCALVFPVPGTGKPRTLRDLLLAPENEKGVRHPLNDRIRLAVHLATAVLYVHTARFVHKAICPENIVVLDHPELADSKACFPWTLGSAYLAGFDFARHEDAASKRAGDNIWWRNLYRHPLRQSSHPETDFSMLHDIYSLGVVLLEIALWESFVLVGPDGSRTLGRQGRSFAKKGGKMKSPADIRVALLKKAREYVPLVLGAKYCEVVVMCLDCFDGGLGPTEELLDGDGVLLGVVFIQRVLAVLEEITV